MSGIIVKNQRPRINRDHGVLSWFSNNTIKFLPPTNRIIKGFYTYINTEFVDSPSIGTISNGDYPGWLTLVVNMGNTNSASMSLPPVGVFVRTPRIVFHIEHLHSWVQPPILTISSNLAIIAKLGDPNEAFIFHKPNKSSMTAHYFMHKTPYS